MISGPVYATVGGGLDSSLRTNWQPNFLPGTVLMVEDVSGYKTLIQRLRKAQNFGALENVQAIIIGNATSAGSKLSDEIPPEVKDFADEIGLPIFLAPDNQFGHLKDKEPTPIVNFGIIEINTSSKSATVRGQNSHDLVRAYQQQNYEKSGSRVGVGEALSDSTFKELETIFETLELFPLNQIANKSRNLTLLENLVGGPTKKLPAQLNTNDKTLLIVDENWVSLGRELTDRYNKGELRGVSSIVVGIDNPYPELKSRLDEAITENTKVAVGLSFLTHPGFKFIATADGRYSHDISTSFDKDIKDLKDDDLKGFVEACFIPWLRAHDIELLAEDIAITGSSFTIPIDPARNSEIFAKIENPEFANQKVRHCEKRIEYFAKRYMEFSDLERGLNQAGDQIDHEVPVFMVDINHLPAEMKTGLFSVESLNVRVVTEERYQPLAHEDKKFVETLNQPQKSWAARMLSDATKGKSLGGYNEI